MTNAMATLSYISYAAVNFGAFSLVHFILIMLVNQHTWPEDGPFVD